MICDFPHTQRIPGTCCTPGGTLPRGQGLHHPHRCGRKQTVNRLPSPPPHPLHPHSLPPASLVLLSWGLTGHPESLLNCPPCCYGRRHFKTHSSQTEPYFKSPLSSWEEDQTPRFTLKALGGVTPGKGSASPPPLPPDVLHPACRYHHQLSTQLPTQLPSWRAEAPGHGEGARCGGNENENKATGGRTQLLSPWPPERWLFQAAPHSHDDLTVKMHR